MTSPSFLARNARSERLVVIGTYRTDELHRRHPLRPWLSEMERLPRVERFELARFGRAELDAQIAAILDHVPAPGLVDSVERRTEGNPFFVEELLASGAEAHRDSLPETLRDVLLTRVTTLSEEAQRVLGMAAVAGRRVRAELLATVAGIPEAELERPLREALASQIVVSDQSHGHRRLQLPPRPPGRGGLRRPAPLGTAAAARGLCRGPRVAARAGRGGGRQPALGTRPSRHSSPRANPRPARLGGRRPCRRFGLRLLGFDARVRTGDRPVGRRAGRRPAGRDRCGDAASRGQPGRDADGAIGPGRGLRPRRRQPAGSEARPGALGGSERTAGSRVLGCRRHGRRHGDPRTNGGRAGGHGTDTGSRPRRRRARRRAHAPRRPSAGDHRGECGDRPRASRGSTDRGGARTEHPWDQHDPHRSLGGGPADPVRGVCQDQGDRRRVRRRRSELRQPELLPVDRGTRPGELRHRHGRHGMGSLRRFDRRVRPVHRGQCRRRCDRARSMGRGGGDARRPPGERLRRRQSHRHHHDRRPLLRATGADRGRRADSGGRSEGRRAAARSAVHRADLRGARRGRPHRSRPGGRIGGGGGRRAAAPADRGPVLRRCAARDRRPSRGGPGRAGPGSSGDGPGGPRGRGGTRVRGPGRVAGRGCAKPAGRTAAGSAPSPPWPSPRPGVPPDRRMPSHGRRPSVPCRRRATRGTAPTHSSGWPRCSLARRAGRRAAEPVLQAAHAVASTLGAAPLRGWIEALARRARISVAVPEAAVEVEETPPTRTTRASPPASARSWRSSPTASPTAESPKPCSSARAPRASTSRTSWASSVSRPGRRRRPSPRGSGWSARPPAQPLRCDARTGSRPANAPRHPGRGRAGSPPP